MLRVFIFAFTLVSAFASMTSSSTAADIRLTGGSADINFYYESAANRWHRVVRGKASTVATGLTSPFTPFTGIVGAGTDFNFDTLTTKLITNTSVNFGGTDFSVSSASGSPLFGPSSPGATADLGIRTRLRENFGSGNVDQFSSFVLSLKVGDSTFNGGALAGSGAEVGLFHWDSPTLPSNPVALLNTAGGLFSTNFANFEHVHRHWGFSERGVYDLAFDFQGTGGLYGATAAPGSFRMSFNVVPEPSTLALLGMGLGCFILRRHRRAL
jgi:hypothetical protein